jgi:hypothetical protein
MRLEVPLGGTPSGFFLCADLRRINCCLAPSSSCNPHRPSQLRLRDGHRIPESSAMVSLKPQAVVLDTACRRFSKLLILGMGIGLLFLMPHRAPWVTWSPPKTKLSLNRRPISVGDFLLGSGLPASVPFGRRASTLAEAECSAGAFAVSTLNLSYSAQLESFSPLDYSDAITLFMDPSALCIRDAVFWWARLSTVWADGQRQRRGFESHTFASGQSIPCAE